MSWKSRAKVKDREWVPEAVAVLEAGAGERRDDYFNSKMYVEELDDIDKLRVVACKTHTRTGTG